MSEKEIGLGRLFLQEAVKEGIEYSVAKAGKEARGVIREISPDKR